MTRFLPSKIAITFLFIASSVPLWAQPKMDRIQRGQVMDMLNNVKNSIKKGYYDPSFKGMDLEARFAAAEEKLKKTEQLNQAFAVIAQAVMDLNDSHTLFYPPDRAAIVEYGWRMKVFGNKVYISGVKKGSDADKKGLRIGDQVLKVNGFAPSRSELWKMIYYYHILSPQVRMVLDLQSPAGESRQLVIDTKITPLKRTVNLTNTIDLNEAAREGEKLLALDRHHFREIGTALVWRMPSFVFDPKQVGDLVARAKGKRTLILDLRGNSGGYVVTLEKLVGYFFDRDLKIADLKGRKPMDPQWAKTQGSKVFPGNVIVLVDSNSASASEIFARVMQLEKRGIVLGDVSAGAVMQSTGVGFEIGDTHVITYGMNMTNADVIMSDGKSLEHTGVIPDEIIIPTGADIAERSDPVLARALELSGNPMGKIEAGKLFPEEPFITRVTNVALEF